LRPVTYSEAFYRGSVFWVNVEFVALDAIRRGAPELKLRKLPRWRQLVIRVYALPYDVPANVFDRLTNARIPLAHELRASSDPTLYKLLTGKLHHHGLARNLSTAFYLVALYSATVLALQGNVVWQLEYDVLLSMPVGFAALAFVLMARYYYSIATVSRLVFRIFVRLSANEARDIETAALTRMHALTIPGAPKSTSSGGARHEDVS